MAFKYFICTIIKIIPVLLEELAQNRTIQVLPAALKYRKGTTDAGAVDANYYGYSTNIFNRSNFIWFQFFYPFFLSPTICFIPHDCCSWKRRVRWTKRCSRKKRVNYPCFSHEKYLVIWRNRCKPSLPILPLSHPIPVVCIMRCKSLGASNEDTFLVVFFGNVLLNFI